MSWGACGGLSADWYLMPFVSPVPRTEILRYTKNDSVRREVSPVTLTIKFHRRQAIQHPLNPPAGSGQNPLNLLNPSRRPIHGPLSSLY